MIHTILLTLLPVAIGIEVGLFRWLMPRSSPTPEAEPDDPYRDAGICPHCRGSGVKRQP